MLADGPELTVAEFPQIAAQVEGFEAAVPAAPAPAAEAGGLYGPGAARRRGHHPADHGDPRRRHGSALGIPAVTESGEIRPLEEIEADMIRLALGRYRGHMTEVAKRLKIGRSTLYRKMQEYGLEPRA